MILDILRTNYDPAKTRVPKPIYFAVTVANSNMIGLRDYLTFEGLVFRINPHGREAMDAAKVKENFFGTFDGHFRGIDDPDVHFDDNVEKLLQNYRSGFLQLAYHYSTQPDTTTVKPPEESLDKMMANFDRLSNRQKSLAVLLTHGRGDPRESCVRFQARNCPCNLDGCMLTWAGPKSYRSVWNPPASVKRRVSKLKCDWPRRGQPI